MSSSLYNPYIHCFIHSDGPGFNSSILIHSLSTMSLKQRRVKFQEILSTFSSLKLWEGHSKYSYTCSIKHNEPFFAKNSCKFSVMFLTLQYSGMSVLGYLDEFNLHFFFFSFIIRLLHHNKHCSCSLKV